MSGRASGLCVVVLVVAAICSTTSAASAYTQTISAGSLSSVSCAPGTTDCVIGESNGNTVYATNVSATAEATWNAWSGPAHPNEAVACPASTLCVLADGENKETGGGGAVYYATSLGGSWTKAQTVFGVVAAYCSSSSFCVAGQKDGHIKYSEKPASTTWPEVAVGAKTEAMNGVFCLSSSFCAAVTNVGELYVADTEAKVKEKEAWKSTDVDGATALHGISCISTTSCVAVDGVGDVLDLTIEGSGAATVSKDDIDGTNELTAITCVSSTCVTVDDQGNIFASTNSGASWSEQELVVGNKLTSVSCASSSLCLAADAAGAVTTFDPAVASSHTQSIDGENSVNAASCIPSSTDCIVSDSKGNAYYATNVSTGTNGTWTKWGGPTEESPSLAVDCPSSALCVLADGKAELGHGDRMYYATSLGGAWKEAYDPTYGVVAVSCASTTLCVTGQAEGYIRYTTNPASEEWFTVELGVPTMSAVDCLSSSFCAVVDSKGNVHIADTATKIKEKTGWKSTDVDGTTALRGISCISTTSCVAVDSVGDVLDLTIESSGVATVASKDDIDGANELTAVSCTGSSTCTAVDAAGNVFVSNNKGETWVREHQFADKLTSVSCASASLCLTADTTGNVTAFDAR